MSFLDTVGLTIAILLMGYLGRNMLEMSSRARDLPPPKPSDPQAARDPITMSWDEPERQDPN